MRVIVILPLLLICAASLGGCSGPMPFDSTETLDRIPFGGVNQANIAAQVVNPADLEHGRSDETASGHSAAVAIKQFDSSHPHGLTVQPTSSAGGAGGKSGG